MMLCKVGKEFEQVVEGYTSESGVRGLDKKLG